jgi:hypothetical protein
MKDSFQSFKEPLEVRFPNNDGTPTIEPFSVGFVLGSSRAMAALIILEICVTLPLAPEDVSEVSKELASLRYIFCNYEPCGGVEDEVERAVLSKMRASERQRPDVLQLARAFGRVADAAMAGGTPGSKAELVTAQILSYNRKQVVANCRVEGEERASVKFLCQQNDEFCFALRTVWNEYRVRESPITAALLASTWLTQVPSTTGPSAVGAKWARYLTPDPAKYTLWIIRLWKGFAVRLERARAEKKAPSLRTRAVL